MSNKLIYLASPYSHPDQYVRYERYATIARIAGKLVKDGHVLFCPITHSHPMAQRSTVPEGAEGHKIWMNLDLTILERCDILYVVMIKGWEESRGVQEEIKFAHNKGLPVYYIDKLGNIAEGA